MKRYERTVYKITKLIYPASARRIEVGEALLLMRKLASEVPDRSDANVALAAIALGLSYQAKVTSSDFSDLLESALNQLDIISPTGYGTAVAELED